MKTLLPASDEVLVALALLSQTDVHSREVVESIPQLDDCQVHAMVMPREVGRNVF